MSTWYDIIAQGHVTPGDRSAIVAAHRNPVELAVIEAWPAGRFDLVDGHLNHPIAEGVTREQIDALLQERGALNEAWQPYTTQLCVYECVLTSEEVAWVEAL